jgi:hypothetical protein
MNKNKDFKVQLAAWSLALMVTLISIYAWGVYREWNITPYSSYTLFPLLGLLAFGLMWTHYIMGTIRDLLKVNEKVLKPFYAWTGYAVLLLICLHPGILIIQRFLDGAGLPPGSYKTYVAPSLAWVTLLGSACLLIFLAFELHRFFEKKTWWHWVVDASDFAMLAIAYHGLVLGRTLSQEWFKVIWFIYASTLLIVIIRKYYLRITTKNKTSPAG